MLCTEHVSITVALCMYEISKRLSKCEISYRQTRLRVIWVKHIGAKWRIYASVIWPSLVQIMACHLVGAKPFGLAKIRVAPGGTLWPKKSKSTKVVSYCAMLYPRCCSLWPCTFWELHSSDFDSYEGQTRGFHFNFYWGTDTTMWSNGHFSCFCVTKIDFYHQL